MPPISPDPEVYVGTSLPPELLWSMALAEQDQRFVESLGMEYDLNKDYGYLQGLDFK